MLRFSYCPFEVSEDFSKVLLEGPGRQNHQLVLENASQSIEDFASGYSIALIFWV